MINCHSISDKTRCKFKVSKSRCNIKKTNIKQIKQHTYAIMPNATQKKCPISRPFQLIDPRLYIQNPFLFPKKRIVSSMAKIFKKAKV